MIDKPMRDLYMLFVVGKTKLSYSFPNANYDVFPAIKWPNLLWSYDIHSLIFNKDTKIFLFIYGVFK